MCVCVLFCLGSMHAFQFVFLAQAILDEQHVLPPDVGLFTDLFGSLDDYGVLLKVQFYNLLMLYVKERAVVRRLCAMVRDVTKLWRRALCWWCRARCLLLKSARGCAG